MCLTVASEVLVEGLCLRLISEGEELHAQRPAVLVGQEPVESAGVGGAGGQQVAGGPDVCGLDALPCSG